MTSGKCPHPWNRKKKGTFKKGHKQINKGRGCFQEGNKPPIEINKKIQKERYKQGLHPFVEINKTAKKHAIKTNYYGIGKSEWIKIRKKIKERDNWICQDCKKDLHRHKSNCHHIIPYKISKNNSYENLITLCISCHIKREMEIRKEISQKAPKKQKV